MLDNPRLCCRDCSSQGPGAMCAAVSEEGCVGLCDPLGTYNSVQAQCERGPPPLGEGAPTQGSDGDEGAGGDGVGQEGAGGDWAVASGGTVAAGLGEEGGSGGGGGRLLLNWWDGAVEPEAAVSPAVRSLLGRGGETLPRGGES